MSIQHTCAELIFGILHDKLKPSTTESFWQAEVRFEKINSDTLAQILSLLISDRLFRFQSGENRDGKSSILFTDHMAKSDVKSFRIIVVDGKTQKNELKVDSEIVRVSGADGNREYSIFWNTEKNLQKSEEISKNVSSQLTRPDIFPSYSLQNIPVPLWKIVFTSEAQYSASPMKASEGMVSEIIQRLNENGFNGKEISFLDGTSNCGADAINSVIISKNLQHSFRISAIELNPLNYQALKENITLFGCDAHIDPIQADVVEWLKNEGEKRSFTCMYFDPPWGGKDYKMADKVQLYLSGINIWTLCREIMSRSSDRRPKLIVVKGPSNWNMEDSELGTIKSHVKFKPFRNIVYAYVDVGKYKS